MAEPSEAEATGPVSPGIEAAVYIDASALAKLYVPEAESERLDAFLRGRLGLMISELAITEVLSAVARRKREGELRPELANEIRGALLADADSGSFARLHLDPANEPESASASSAPRISLASSGRNSPSRFLRATAESTSVIASSEIIRPSRPRKNASSLSLSASGT